VTAVLRQLEPPLKDLELQDVDLEPGSGLPGRAFIGLMFGGLWIWWILGVSGFIQNLLVLPLLLPLVLRGRIRSPRLFAWWYLYLVWVGISIANVSDFEGFAAYAFRGTLYVSSTVLFLYIYNSPRKSLPTMYIVKILAAFWVLTTIGGIIGSLVPNFDFTTPFEAILPSKFLTSRFVFDVVHASNSSPQAFGATEIHRPRVPFNYTNTWGSIFVMTLPFAVATLFSLRSRLWRVALLVLIAVSIFPLVYSFNRGAWLSVGLAMPYALLRIAVTRRSRIARYARTLLIVGMTVGLVSLFSGLPGLIVYRLERGYSNEGRTALVRGSFFAANVSPIVGWGNPIEPESIGLPHRPVSLGTQGQIWAALVSQGYPGFIFFLVWFILIVFKTGKVVPATGGRDPTARLWAHVALFAAALQLPFYDFMPWGILVVMVAAALALREARPAFVTVRKPPPGHRVTAPALAGP
jgi:polysaccharide biosynthesis protein PslJ